MFANFSNLDSLSVCVILAGIVCQMLHRKFPRGLGTSLFVAGASVGLGIAVFHHHFPATGDLNRAYLLGGLLCALWAFFGRLSSRARQASDVPDANDATRGSSAAFLAWSLVCGAATFALITYVLFAAAWPRVTAPATPTAALPLDGLFALLGLVLATLLWGGTRSRSGVPTLLLFLAGVAIWWTSFMIPSASLGDQIRPESRLPLQPGWWTWAYQMQLGLAVVLVVAAVLQELRYRSRRKNAWPDRLDDLLLPYSRWPGYIQVEAVFAGVILILGVYQLLRPGWQLPLAGGIASLLAGVACLFMTYRRWSANTAGLGMALTALAVVALACALATPFYAVDDSIESAERMPVLFNAILVALWLMVGLWYGLARFWDQQLLRSTPASSTSNGKPWTTAGRMIPYAQRTGFLLTALAVLVAFQMAFWPIQDVAANQDDGLWRLVCGGAVILLHALQNIRVARRRDSSPAATMAVALLLAGVVFIFVRLPASSTRGWLIQYDSVVLGALCLPVLLLAEALHRTKWRSMSTPLWFLALLILPSRALIKLLAHFRLPADWVRPATLGILGAVYSFAGGREHRRAFLILGAVLLIVALWELYRL